MGNRLRELRLARELSVAEAAAVLGTSRSKLYKMERGEQRLNDAWLRRFARAYDCLESDILVDGPKSIPVALPVSADALPAAQDCGPRRRIVPPDFLTEPTSCFAAEVLDDSADGLRYPRRSVLIVRPLEALEAPPAVGDKIMILDNGGNGRPRALVGLLDVSVAGDLVLVTRSSRPDVPASIVIRRAAQLDRDVPKGRAAVRGLDPYQPREGDRAEILGRIVAAITPE